MQVAAVGASTRAATTYQPLPVNRGADVETPAQTISTAEQAPAMAASAMLTARLPDAALVAMQQSLANLSSGVVA